MTVSPYGGSGERPSHPAIDRGKLALITDLTRCPHLSLQQQAELGREGGTHLLLLRAPELGEGTYEAAAREITKTWTGDGLLVIYDNPDLAAELGVGVQVGKNDEPVSSIRKRLGNLVVGYSAHSLTEAVQAARDGATFVLLSLLFPTSKDGFSRSPLEDHVWANTYEVGVPVFALGGVQVKNLKQAMDLGVRRVAVSTGVLCADDPRIALGKMLEMLGPPPGKRKRVLT